MEASMHSSSEGEKAAMIWASGPNIWIISWSETIPMALKMMAIGMSWFKWWMSVLYISRPNYNFKLYKFVAYFIQFILLQIILSRLWNHIGSCPIAKHATRDMANHRAIQTKFNDDSVLGTLLLNE